MRFLLKRWWFWLGIVLIGMLGTGTALTLTGGSRINQANYDRTHEGMTIAQVNAVLGPDDIAQYRQGDPANSHGIWTDGPDMILVKFVDGRLAAKRFSKAFRLEKNPMALRAILEKV